jgi:hypothetical protein
LSGFQLELNKYIMCHLNYSLDILWCNLKFHIYSLCGYLSLGINLFCAFTLLLLSSLLERELAIFIWIEFGEFQRAYKFNNYLLLNQNGFSLHGQHIYETVDTSPL